MVPPRAAARAPARPRLEREASGLPHPLADADRRKAPAGHGRNQLLGRARGDAKAGRGVGRPPQESRPCMRILFLEECVSNQRGPEAASTGPPKPEIQMGAAMKSEKHTRRNLRLLALGLIIGLSAYWAGSRWGPRVPAAVEALRGASGQVSETGLTPDEA